MKSNTFYSNGKLLISGEYAILDGALSIAIPTKHGQSLNVETLNEPKLIWNSLNEKGNVWFETEFIINQSEIVIPQNSSNGIEKRLVEILNAAKKLNPDFLKKKMGYKATTTLDFPRNWGLGTSSTLINNIAEWANINPYKLLENTFGGSGYDIACAQNNHPISYQLKKGEPVINTVNFKPSFKSNLYFIHLNKKQNSRAGIKHYQTNKENATNAISEISEITLKMISCSHIMDFQHLINQHENIISKLTKQTPIKQLLFDDFSGSIKSLGAWGGDFILAATKTSPYQYFNEKGYKTILPYEDMAL